MILHNFFICFLIFFYIFLYYNKWIATEEETCASNRYYVKILLILRLSFTCAFLIPSLIVFLFTLHSLSNSLAALVKLLTFKYPEKRRQRDIPTGVTKGGFEGVEGPGPGLWMSLSKFCCIKMYYCWKGWQISVCWTSNVNWLEPLVLRTLYMTLQKAIKYCFGYYKLSYWYIDEF